MNGLMPVKQLGNAFMLFKCYENVHSMRVRILSIFIFLLTHLVNVRWMINICCAYLKDSLFQILLNFKTKLHLYIAAYL